MEVSGSKKYWAVWSLEQPRLGEDWTQWKCLAVRSTGLRGTGQTSCWVGRRTPGCQQHREEHFEESDPVHSSTKGGGDADKCSVVGEISKHGRRMKSCLLDYDAV
jgi:hypothetical protein